MTNHKKEAQVSHKKIISGVRQITILGLTLFMSACTTNTLKDTFSGTEAKDNKPIVIAVDGGYPPFSMTQADGTVTGLDIDLANAVCDKAKIQCELVKTPWDNMIPLLEQGKIDAIVASLNPTQERKKRIDFTDSYANIGPRFIGKTGGTLKLTEAFMHGKRIGVEATTSLDGYVSSEFEGALIKRVRSVKALNNLLMTKEVDYILTDALVASYGFLNTPQGQAYQFLGPELKSEKWFGDGTAITINKKAVSLKLKLNKAIKKMHEDGTYSKALKKYL